MTVRPRPLGPRVLVKPLPADDSVRGSGIVLPEEARSKERRAVVMAVGTIWKDWDATGELDEGRIPLQEGDVVIYMRGTGVGVSLDVDENGLVEELLVLDLREVLLVLEDVPAAVSR